MEEKEWVDEERSPQMGCLIRNNFVIKRVICIADINDRIGQES